MLNQCAMNDQFVARGCNTASATINSIVALFYSFLELIDGSDKPIECYDGDRIE